MRGGHAGRRLRVALGIQRHGCGRDDGHLLLGRELACFTFSLRATRARAAAPTTAGLDEFHALIGFCSGEDRLPTRREGAALAVGANRADEVVEEVGIVHGIGQHGAIFLGDQVPNLGGLVLRLARLGVGVVLRHATVLCTVLCRHVTQVSRTRSNGRAGGLLVVRVAGAGGAVALWDIAHRLRWRGCGQAAVHTLEFPTVLVEAQATTALLASTVVRSCVVAYFARHTNHLGFAFYLKASDLTRCCQSPCQHEQFLLHARPL